MTHLSDRPAPEIDEPVPDVLGPGWTARTIHLRPDDEGDVVATLVRRTPPAEPTRRAVLYVHGFDDYFFQSHLGDAWAEQGFDFYALDLRKYGRSLRPGQSPNYVTDLRDYLEELDAAAQVIRDQDDHDVMVVLGHSTGGLLASLWAHSERGSGLIDAVVLNSPWFDLDRGWFERVALTRTVDVVGRFVPRLPIGATGSDYGRSLHRETGGAWDYDLTWKPHEGFPVRAGWLRTIRRGHARIAQGLDIDCPVLVCCSTASGPHDRLHPDIGTTDSVLGVEQIVARSTGLGAEVTVAQIPGGVHDLALSGPVARQHYFDVMFDWVRTHVPGGDLAPTSHSPQPPVVV
ncbi:alpha/beta hydrolase [Pengzhenrongella frigida]|uniref:Alpha/beta hydrolase n=1 Tax=Pengzhenrongella frigida TaxID=1259133 RepID=A0A4Q5N0I6_9MICO|nr:alpha/beta hydrolase [Cellulomonas sp. HLT2-17]RYV51578.1 alpha/beta hydrolase [Cellulomonas sp. HLT2-17]